MKTSILISSIAAICLLATFAVAPRQHGEDNISLTSTDNISIVSAGSATMLPGVVITAEKNKAEEISIPFVPVEDFTYLKFEVAEYMEADATNTDETEVLPEAAESGLSYLKFNVGDYMSDSELSSDAIAELPVSELNTSAPVPATNEFEYLRFDVNDFIGNTDTETAGIGELPAEETSTMNPSGENLPGVIPPEFGYLKFVVTKYYDSAKPGNDTLTELPEK